MVSIKRRFMRPLCDLLRDFCGPHDHFIQQSHRLSQDDPRSCNLEIAKDHGRPRKFDDQIFVLLGRPAKDTVVGTFGDVALQFGAPIAAQMCGYRRASRKPGSVVVPLGWLAELYSQRKATGGRFLTPVY